MTTIYKNRLGAYMEVLNMAGTIEARVANSAYTLRFHMWHYNPNPFNRFGPWKQVN